MENKILTLKETTLKSFAIQSYEILDTEKQVRLLLVASKFVKWIIILLQLLISLPIFFSIFPGTKGIALQLLGYFIIPIKKIFFGVIGYIPNLITIFVICFAIRSLVRLARYIATEIENGNLKSNGFFQDQTQVHSRGYRSLWVLSYHWVPAPL